MSHHEIGKLRAIVVTCCIAAAGCAEEESTPAPAEGDALALDTTAVTLEAGEEVYLCWSVQIPPGEEFGLTGIDFDVPADIHHYQVQAQATEPEPGPYECSGGMGGGGAMGGGNVGFPTILAVGGPGTAPGVRYPEGTATPLEPGSWVVMQFHVLNATGAAREYPAGRAELRHTHELAGLQKVGVVLVNDSGVDIPPTSTGITAGARCDATAPLENVFAVWPHMHLLGQHIDVTLGADRVVDTAWNFEEQRFYPTDLRVDAGDPIEIGCVYDNPTQAEVKFGMSTKDEMCTAFVWYWPAVEGFGLCEN
jgi:copper type II ascorbate-dependent monooxygenase-like protein